MLPLFLSLYLTATGAVQGRLASLQDRDDRGQGTLEYVGMIVVAALIVVAVAGAFTDADLGGRVGKAIESVTNLG